MVGQVKKRAPKSKATKPRSTKAKTKTRKVPKAAPKKRKVVRGASPRGSSNKTKTKRKLTPAQESKRASEVAGKRAPQTKARRRAKKSREKRGEIEARLHERGKRKELAAYENLLAAAERMRDSAPVDLELSFEAPPTGVKTPWLVVAVFRPTAPMGYFELADLFQTWEDDLFLEASIGPRRWSWIRWNYRKGKHVYGFAPAALGEWSTVITEARRLRHPVQRDKTLAEVYDDSEIGMPDDEGNGGIQVHWSSTVGKSNIHKVGLATIKLKRA